MKKSNEIPSVLLRFRVDKRSLFSVVIVGLLLFSLTPLASADYHISPRITVSEEYNDNLFEVETNRKTDYITRAQPGIALRYNAPFWDWDLSYGYDYRHYAKRLRSDESTHNFTGSGSIRLIENLLFLDLRDTYSRVSLDVSRNSINDSLFVNQTDQNVFTASPYFIIHPSASITVRTGYIYADNWYKEPTAESRRRHSGFLDISYEMTSKFFFNSGYRFDRELSPFSNFYRHEASIGPKYEYAEKSFISAQGGATFTEYDHSKAATSPYWNVGITHTFDTLIASVSSSVKYTDDPRGGSIRENAYASLTIQKNLAKGTISVNSSYSELFDVNSNVWTTERLVAGINGTYEIVEHLNGTLGSTFEHYRYLTLHGTTNRYYADCGLSYAFGNNLSLALNYRYINYESAQIVNDNMQANRIFLEITKLFNQ